MAITTSNSIKVKACRWLVCWHRISRYSLLLILRFSPNKEPS